ncbi:putative DNA binding domain-containing protein [Patescibacteria group bacterium]|nr:putative DNA binding domain-containing protein [Patescibacteria group bacterium]
MFEKEIKLFNSILETLRNRTNNNETSLIELKENNVNPDEIGKSISAIANACILEKADSGYIIFGVEDSTLQEKGVSFDPFNLKSSGQQDMEMYLRQMLVAGDFRFAPFKKDGKDYFLIEVFKSLGSPANYKNISYIRIGKNTSSLKNYPELEGKIWASFHTGYFWKKLAKTDLSYSEVLNLLDFDAYYQMMKLPIPSETQDILIRFEQEGFVIKQLDQWYITNLGALLFARDLKSFDNLQYKSPRVITYEGDHKLSTVIKDQEGKKGYASGFEDLIKWIYSQVPEPEVITKIYREQKITYPEKAIREIVANALIHQDCEADGMRPVIEIYKNHIEISNPGSCLVDPKKIIESVPKARNERMVDVMRRLKICEIRGSGIDRAIEAIEFLQLPAPKFENIDNAFSAYIYAYRPFEKLTMEEKLRALYQHVTLFYVQQQFATNTSLRLRFGLGEKKGWAISKIVTYAKDSLLIKNFDPNSASRRYIKYVPIWA